MKRLKRFKEIFRWIAIGGVIPVILCSSILHIVWLGGILLAIQLSSFVMMFILGWEYE